MFWLLNSIACLAMTPIANRRQRGGSEGGFGAIILAVAHNEFLTIDLKKHKDQGCVIYDVKGILNKDMIEGNL
jgi:UDP-N-acetyl-D-mannosaminuronate dehydrogenase